MNDTSWGYYGGASGVASANGAAWLGTIATGAQLNEDDVNGTLFNNPPQPTSGIVPYYGGAYRKLLTAATTASNVRLYNRAGALLNLAAGIPSVLSTDARDLGTLGAAARTGLQVRVVGKVSGVFVEQFVNLNGRSQSSDVNGGAQMIDTGQCWRWEASLNGNPTTFYGDVGCFIGTQLCAVIRGTANPRRGIAGKGNQMCSAEVKLAVASSKSANISGTDRLVAPSGIGSFDPAVYFGGVPDWVGTDQSLACPGNPYVTNDYFGFVVEFSAIAGIFSPLGNFQADPDVLCNA